MKKKLLSMICVVTGMLAISCTKDTKTVDIPDNQKLLTFVFSGLDGGAITYAIATDDENEVTDIEIYMFEYSATQDGAFRQKFTSSEYTLSKVGTQHTLTITADLQTYGSTEMTFYFVANPSPTTHINTATLTTEKDFAEYLTEVLQKDADNKGELLVTPLLFTGKTNTPIKPDGSTVTETVTMNRRVARFDIVNNFPNLVIEEIYVSDANLQGYAFGNALGTNNPTFPTGSLKKISINDPADYQTIGADRTIPHVFYMYPTKLDEPTTIAIKANLNGQGSELYYIDSDIEIKANYRYKMTVDGSVTFGTVKFTLDYVDWSDEPGVDIDKKKAFRVDGYEIDGAATHANWDLANKTFDLRGNTATKLTFVVHNALETKETISLEEGDWTDVTGGNLVFTKTEIFTYGINVLHTYEVILPTPAGSNNFVVKMRVANVANDEQYEEIYFNNMPDLIKLSYFYHNRGSFGDGYPALNQSVVPNGLRIYAMENMPASLDYPSGTFVYNLMMAPTSGSAIYNTNKRNDASSWTFISVSNSDEVRWTDENPTSGTSNLENLYISAYEHPDKPGLYRPFNYTVYWQMNSYEQGATLSDPEEIRLKRMNFTTNIILENIENIPGVIDPVTPPTLEYDKLWVQIEDLPITSCLGTGGAVFTSLADPVIKDIYGKVYIDGFVDYTAGKIRTPVKGMFGPAQNDSDPNFRRPIFRLMYEDQQLYAFSCGVLYNTTHYNLTYTFKSDFSVAVNLNGLGSWSEVIITPIL